MTILSVVFVVSQSLVLVHELMHRPPASESGR
jgi:hypothetical protein